MKSIYQRSSRARRFNFPGSVLRFEALKRRNYNCREQHLRAYIYIYICIYRGTYTSVQKYENTCHFLSYLALECKLSFAIIEQTSRTFERQCRYMYTIRETGKETGSGLLRLFTFTQSGLPRISRQIISSMYMPKLASLHG